MFPDQCRGMIAPGGEGLYYGIAGGRVAEGDGNIPQPALVTNAFDGRAFSFIVEFLCVPVEEFY